MTDLSIGGLCFKTEDRGQRAEDRGRDADRGQRTEGRGQGGDAGIEICQAALGETHSQAALGNDRRGGLSFKFGAGLRQHSVLQRPP